MFVIIIHRMNCMGFSIIMMNQLKLLQELVIYLNHNRETNKRRFNYQSYVLCPLN